MNVFVLPSWYPHRCHPLHGVFTLEQAAAIADLHPDWNVAISVWGQGEARLSMTHLTQSPRCLRDALAFQSGTVRVLAPNRVEFLQRAFSWNEKLVGGNRDGILAANRRNLQAAIDRFGRMDLLHAHVAYPAGWVAMKLSAETGIPFVVTEHMGPFPLPVYARADDTLWDAIRAPLASAGATTAVSEILCERIASFGLPRPEYVPNVVDERALDPARRRPHEKFTFFTLGGMYPVKGWPILLRAIRAALDRMTPAERGQVVWRLSGYGPNRAEYHRLAVELELGPWIEWLGFIGRDGAHAEFHGCDCYVLSSLHESFGVPLVEAMAAGVPVVATRCGGPERIVSEATGLLVPSKDPQALAEGMLRVLRREKPWDVAAMREEFLHRYSRPAVVARLDEVFALAIERQTRAAQ